MNAVKEILSYVGMFALICGVMYIFNKNIWG